MRIPVSVNRSSYNEDLCDIRKRNLIYPHAKECGENAILNKDDEAYLDFLDSIYIDPQGTMEETRVLGREIIESCGVRLHYIRFAFA